MISLPEPTLNREAAMEMWLTERSEYAKEQVILSNTGIVGSTLKSLNLDIADDDLFMVGLMGLTIAVDKFDPEANAAFRTFAVAVVRNSVLKTFQKKRIATLYFEQPYRLKDGGEICLGDTIVSNEDMEESVSTCMLLRELNETLTDTERMVVRLRLDGNTQEQIGREIGCSQAHTSRILGRIRKKANRKWRR